MTIEQVKEEAKKRFNMELTDEQAQAWLEEHNSGELQDDELQNVAGGGCSDSKLKCQYCGYDSVDAKWIKEYEVTKVEFYCKRCGRRVG